jgi:hypothetical protein
MTKEQLKMCSEYIGTENADFTDIEILFQFYNKLIEDVKKQKKQNEFVSPLITLMFYVDVSNWEMVLMTLHYMLVLLKS